MARPTNESKETRRKARIPLGTQKLRLTANNIPADKVGRWINDDAGRIQQALDAGYDFIESESIGKIGEEAHDGNTAIDSRISMNVKKDEHGRPVRAYLMAIDRDLYIEDQEEKQRRLDETDAAIKGGTYGDANGQNRYVPKSGIKIDRK